VSKPQSIDPQKDYPCPCCRGQISPLVLTEAFGCDRCQKIFVLRDNNLILEQISNPYPHSWQWDGQTWQSTKSLAKGNFSLYLAICIVLLALASGTWYFWTDSREYPPPTKTFSTEHQDR
jgi:hypothetical protein